MVPPELSKHDEEVLAKYSENLYKAINAIEFCINNIVSLYFKSELEWCNNYFDLLRNKLINIGYDYEKLSKFYEIYFYKMSKELIETVGSNCRGYDVFSGVPFNNATSINELLHIIHQTIVNNRNNFKELPIIASKKNMFDEDIFLYGYNNALAYDIYENFSENFDCGTTDIVSLDHRILMMVRERGHALSIEIKEVSGKYYVDYFIPKICNIDMVNALKGITKVNSSSKYARGKFDSTREELPTQIINFISMVPTDSDRVINNDFDEEEVIYYDNIGKSFK